MQVIRTVTENDAERMAEIYAPFVTDTSISFEIEPPTAEQFRERIRSTLIRFPWLVTEVDGRIAAYAYATRHRERAAYQWSVDVSVYVDPAYHRRGIGAALYRRLFEIVRAQGYYNAYAGVALPNEASVSIHESLGFQLIGTYRHTGYKFGKWHDVAWFQLTLREPAPNPAPPIAFPSLW